MVHDLAQKDWKIGRVRIDIGIGVMFGIVAAIGPNACFLALGPFYLSIDW